ncbi:PTS sugar transporter subunit IIC [Xenorhabdus sp. 42]|uniref:PTS sugar transporter subunit IIC n=1 Tax=Xenorhabdus szentirmaii TaxID=290112 RepID=UPI000C03A330|nr:MULTISPECIES: PTS transporter subunit EIIC [Xenorhabdus]MBD2780950.1 PTS sugar transporter subunit IIC [Xenorhabdus sp. 38]MBD2792525.1 PTS sugar transporter subunit IIC [Xenorhabdus sp. CUL]MBD2819230.1 PTS sugar transporter subunit IIC [Xenorhabdus sp. 42]MBD2826211.1 PTS sugar transporter subunit IIC [Xenorhabdus sp. 5]PHM42688.1 PTS system cellobiose-specific transporter subunit IIC [Xenorhabdus szentirmaii]
MGIYASLTRIVESHIAPVAGKIGSQRHIIAIRDGFISAMPFLIIGSIMLIIANPPFDAQTSSSFGQAWLIFAKKHWATITMPFFMTMGLMSVFVSVGTAYSLAKSYNLDGLTAGLLSLMAFLLAAAPQADNKMPLDFLGGAGVFTALICAIWSVELIRLLKKYNIAIRLPSQVPPAIARSFELLYPVMGILLTVYPISLLLQSEFELLLPEAVMRLFEPLIAVGDTLPAIMLLVLLANLLWFAGIHGDNIVTGLLNPIFMANIAANAALVAQGMATTQILTAPYWAFYVCIGGSGSTLVLAFLYLRSRSIHLKTIGKLGVVPAIFNINEPLLFGSPIVMNPTLLIPLLIVPLVNAVLAYGALHLDFVEKMVAISPWTAPAPVGALISAAWDYRAFLLVGVLMVIDLLIWYPFFKVYEKQLLAEEQKSKDEAGAAT